MKINNLGNLYSLYTHNIEKNNFFLEIIQLKDKDLFLKIG